MVWSLVRVPIVADEDGRQVDRDPIEIASERTALLNWVKGLLAGLGVKIPSGISRHEQGISSPGNRLVRRMMIQLACKCGDRLSVVL
jgi:hypothetical protein